VYFVLVESLAIDPSNPTHVYAGVGSFGDVGAVLHSTDAGNTWNDLNLPSYITIAGSVDYKSAFFQLPTACAVI
jgi:hypothetical protein